MDPTRGFPLPRQQRGGSALLELLEVGRTRGARAPGAGSPPASRSASRGPTRARRRQRLPVPSPGRSPGRTGSCSGGGRGRTQPSAKGSADASPTSKRTRPASSAGRRRPASSTIPEEMSTPITSASGKRDAASWAPFPVPVPRSRIRAGGRSKPVERDGRAAPPRPRRLDPLPAGARARRTARVAAGGRPARAPASGRRPGREAGEALPEPRRASSFTRRGPSAGSPGRPRRRTSRRRCPG